MFVGESKNWKTIEIRSQLNLYCIGSKSQMPLVAIKR